MAKVILFGNGQIASCAYAYLKHDSTHEVVAFTVDREYLTETSLFGLPIVPFQDVRELYPPSDHKMLVSVSFRGVNKLRAAKYAQGKAFGYEMISYVSSKASTWPELTMGDNCVIGENATILPFASIGNNVMIGSGAIIGHHSRIGDHCWITGGSVISGSVSIGARAFVGANATVRDRLKIGEACVIGAGVTLLANAKDRTVYMADNGRVLPIDSDQLPME